MTIILNDILFSIINYISKDSNLIVRSVDNYGDNKLTIALETVRKTTLMIEILPNGTCDVSLLAEDLGEFLYTKANIFETIKDLENYIFKFISDFE